ncbi:hypothetical protein LCI18_012283 [Fusarium solani-melongenae]|uniref:Uncharacterized protein n=1 Tax=Fusarium solani subsp. cucurbitae TaxID=2747967 RepID=A0ACD3ZJ65_FUSSC|nr:hypothetical protein LCI18_012283 [Fusarium solani-melongenae]
MSYFGQQSNYFYDASASQDQATSPSAYQYDSYSYPLARGASSGGSSTASTVPESPMPSNYYYNDPSAVNYSAQQQDPAYQQGPAYLQDSTYQDSYSSAYPAGSEDTIVPRGDGPSGHDAPAMCLFAGCNAKPFKRTADLQRHYRNIHNADSTKEAHFCDYPRCTRASEPFRRRDHFRDHLREYHREDIQKRGVVVNEEWLEDRYYATNWWRCPRCLIRVSISKDDYECPRCKGSCEPKRKEKRRSRS